MLYILYTGIPWWLSGKEFTCNAEDTVDEGSVPGSGWSSRERNGNPLQYFCLGNSMDRGAWWATVHRVTKSWAWLKWLSTQATRTFKVWFSDCGLLGKPVESLPSRRWGPSSLPLRRPQSNRMTLSLPGWWHREEVAGFLGVREPWEVMSPGAVLHSHLQLYILFRAVHIALQHLIQQP